MWAFCVRDDGLSDKWALGPFGHFWGFRIMTCQINVIALCLLQCIVVFGNINTNEGKEVGCLTEKLEM